MIRKLIAAAFLALALTGAVVASAGPAQAGCVLHDLRNC